MWPVVIAAFVAIVFSTFVFLATRFKRCPSDKILVIYGKVADNRSAKCMHGGGAMVWPLIQDYAYLSLTPMTISIPLQNALSLQNIRINVPSTFTVGVSTDPKIMNNAAERLLMLSSSAMEDMAKEIIFGQLRLTVASLTIEQINQDRESFLDSVRKNVEPELNKIGLYLINVNITDITDTSNYIESIGKKAASEAINKARVDVAQQQKLGAIGESDANRERAVQVARTLPKLKRVKRKRKQIVVSSCRNRKLWRLSGKLMPIPKRLFRLPKSLLKLKWVKKKPKRSAAFIFSSAKLKQLKEKTRQKLQLFFRIQS
jgi:flotillin